MATMIYFSTYAVVAVFALLSTSFIASAMDEDRKVYIVYMGGKLPGEILTQEVHTNLLDGILEGSSSRESLVHSYTRSFNGFSAKLTEKEVKKIADLENVVSVFPNRNLTYQTTRSWDFLQFPTNVSRNPTKESDMIIGVIDGGITPSSSSFADDGFGPPPAKWKGVCEQIKCNNKLIGARGYSGSSPVDVDGHGTHTASIAAGMNVDGVSLFGINSGITRGAVPSARIAVYRVCTPYCLADSTLAAFDDAIADGVDILSISLGFNGNEYFHDPIAIGAFHAMKYGVLTSAAAGNQGPAWRTLGNVAPWMIVVAASNINPHIVANVKLGDGTIITGAAVNTFPTPDGYSPILYLGDESSIKDCSKADGRAEGKIVVCSGESDYRVPKHHGAVGVVIVKEDGTYLDTSVIYSYRAVAVNSTQAKQIFSYIKNTERPEAVINQSEGMDDDRAPRVTSFSSRGPNNVTFNILKPDISAPGINILAAWPQTVPLTDDRHDDRTVAFNMLSGTSMACPHVSGVAAYVKSFHPGWSSAMIMSALMTSATPMGRSDVKDKELSFGAGQINPLNAVNPGLIYDTTVPEYVKMLCDQGYDQTNLRLVTKDDSTCPDGERGDPKDMNYPSMAILVKPGETFKDVTFKRTVTNVGDEHSKYTVKITSDLKLSVAVEPQSLSFDSVGEKQTFVVTVSGEPLEANSIASASIEWTNEKHNVRSPLVVYT